jgi:mRNA interferase RelE/StbE
MSYEVKFKKSAVKELADVPQKEQQIIIEKIEDLSENPYPHGYKKLKGEEAYRIRIGNYRVIYTIDNGVLEIEVIRIGHRKNIYM